MLSKNNRNELRKQQATKRQRFTIKKLTVGTASVLVGLTFLWGGTNTAKADDTTAVAQEAATTQIVNQASVDSSNSTINEVTNDSSNTVDKQASETPVANDTTSTTATDATKNEATAEQPLPSYYNITVNYRDVTRNNNPIQVLQNGKYVYKQPFQQNVVRPGDNVYQIFKAPVAGYKLMNPEVLDQYFTFNQMGFATLKEGIADQDINITLDYAVLSPIKVEYVDVDNGNVLASMVLHSYWMSTESPAHQAGDEKAPDASRYEGAAIDIPGYELVSEPVLDGQITGQTQNSLTDPNYIHLTFKYKKVMENDDAETTTPDKDGTGAVIVDDWTTLPGSFSVQGVYGTRVDGDGNGDVEKKTSDLINRYKNQGFSYVGNTGKYLNSDYYNYYQTAGHIYLIPNKSVVVRFVDEQGNTLADSETIEFNNDNPDQTNQGINPQEHWYAKGEWQAKPKEIEGYHLVRTVGATSGQFTAYQYVTTFVYAKNPVDPIDPEDDVPGTPVDPAPTDPEYPVEPETPTPTDPETPETPETPTPTDPETPAAESTPVVPVTHETTKSTQSEYQLPQTGNNDQLTIVGLIASLLTGWFALLGFKKRQD